MNERNFVLVRSPKELIEKGQIGYGWDIDFSKYNNITDLINEIEDKYGIGRKRKQVERYFNLKKDDIVIVPLSGAIAIAEVIGEKSFQLNPNIKFSENRVTVKYLSDNNGNIFIPRKSLSTELQSRLKLRMSVASLNDFSEEIEKHVESLKKGEQFTWSSAFLEQEEKIKEEFKEKLLSKIQNSKVNMEAGGYGLEKIVKELLEINGYKANIQAKNKSSGIDDVDIIATKINDFTKDKEALYIQVKHHKGSTGNWGIEQLKAFSSSDEESSYSRKILITTGCVEDDIKNEAESSNIVVIDGELFVELLYDNLDKLSENTKTSLGISSVPSLIKVI